MAGGGLTTETPLTAEGLARAIVAAAGVYGDCPVRAVEVERGHLRRSLIAAVAGVVDASGVTAVRVSRILGVDYTSVSRAKRGGQIEFTQARHAASKAFAPAAAAPPPSPPRPILVDAPSLRPPTRTLTARAAQREVATLLAVEPHSAGQLMEALRLGEGQVRDALRALADAGEVRCDPLTAEGWAKQTWRVAA